jgi:RNA polymerase sigma-70 factor (ECF subfamily)
MLNQKFESEEQALLKLAAGDLAAYRFLFDRYFTDLCNFLNLYLHSRQFSEEVALDIFEYIWEKRESLQIRVTFKSFLFSSAKYRAISHYRKEHRAIFTSLELSESTVFEESSSRDFMEENELRRFIELAINKLPEKSRQIYLLARDENLTHKEIALQLGISPKTVENHVGIALRKLRESLMPFYKQIFMGWILPFLLK